ncbi:hypothetical protein SteCoe_32878 [Stentor coeruleus]|uniref:Uncharacterized protein n=1 Tax=Stentor coeruleus TaxID=5963 RepID=A0A1R2AYG0_9CILI|nr:hypothetical protein SteCoe_32878 [Stentor coeruleus]
MKKDNIKSEICASLKNLISSYLKEKQQNINIIVSENTIVADFDIDDDVKREIKIDIENYVYIIYTWNTKLVVENPYIEDEAILYLASINSKLNSTCLVFENELGTFRYKSSQVFPRNRDFSLLFKFFCQIHDAHFPLLEDSIKKFISIDGTFYKENAEALITKIESSNSK